MEEFLFIPLETIHPEKVFTKRTQRWLSISDMRLQRRGRSKSMLFRRAFWKPSHRILLQPVAPLRAGVSPTLWAELYGGVRHISRLVDSRGMSVGAGHCNPCSQRETEAGSSETPSAASACSHENTPPPKLVCITKQRRPYSSTSSRCKKKKRVCLAAYVPWICVCLEVGH